MNAFQRTSVVLAVTSVTLCPCLAGQPNNKVVKLRLSSNGSATVSEQLKGDQFLDIVIRGGAGQTWTIVLQGQSGSPSFNLLPPGSKDVAMFIGSTAGNKAIKRLPDDGDYTIRVYQPRPDERRGVTAKFKVTVTASGKAIPPVKAGQDALITGTRFHAQSVADCKLETQPDTKKCDVFVVRREGGAATIEFRTPQFRRTILFVGGKVVASDTPTPFSQARNGDTHVISFGTAESYRFSDALISGG